MRWDESSSFLSRIRAALSDPWVVANLILRLVLAVMVLRSHGFMQTDSQYYLENAEHVCQGMLGGDGSRTPMYSWLLCGFSFWKAAQIALALLFQTLIVWLAGLFLYRREYRLPALLWLFDPVLLAYSNIVMTDVLFAVSALGLALSIRDFLSPDASLRSGAWVGLWAGVAILLRPIGIPLIGLTWAGIGLLVFFRKIRLKSWVAATALLFSCLSPVLLWNHSRHHRWYLANQGDQWIKSVAGVVQYRGSGLSFFETETRWNREHPNTGSGEAYRVIAENLPSWAWLTTKGIGRVLIGNINSEYAAIFTGHVPLGPGWFKEGDQNSNARVQGISLIFWVIGLLLSAGYYLYLYRLISYNAFRSWGKFSSSDRLWVIWAAVSAGFLVVIPQVYGDARFRAPIISLLLTGLLLINRQTKQKLQSPGNH